MMEPKLFQQVKLFKIDQVKIRKISVKLTTYRPTILNGIFDESIKEQSEKPVHPPTLPPKPRLKDSKSTEFDEKSSKHAPVVTFASSTLDRCLFCVL